MRSMIKINISNGDTKMVKDKENLEKKVQKAVARKHKVKPTMVLYLILLCAALGVAIYIIEYYQ